MREKNDFRMLKLEIELNQIVQTNAKNRESCLMLIKDIWTFWFDVMIHNWLIWNCLPLMRHFASFILYSSA